MNTPNTVFYGRVSTDRQDTYEEQLAEVRAFCAREKGLILDGEALGFYESGVTGEYFAHGAYQRMLDYIRAHKNIRHIAVRDISRFGRPGHRKAEVERDRLASEFGVIVLSANEAYMNEEVGEREYDEWGNLKDDPARMGKAVSRTAIDEANFAMRKRIGENSRRSIMAALHRGSPPGGRMPAFFCAVETGQIGLKGNPERRVIPDPATREIHQAMFDFIAKGGSLPGLSRWLKERGITSPGIRLRCGKVEGKPGNPIPPNTLRYLLMNYMFVGEYVYNRYAPKCPGNTQGRRFRPREFWRIFENYCEPTVKRETFFKVQEILGSAERPQLKHKALLTGVLYCGLCGAKMTVVHSRGYSAYRCSGKKNGTTVCTASEATVKSLDGLVEKLLLDHYFAPGYMEPFCSSTGIAQRHGSARDAEIEGHEARLTEIAAELAEVASIPGMSLSLRSTMMRTLESEREAVSRALGEAKNAPAAEIDYTGLSASLREWWDEAAFGERRDFVKASFERLTFTRDSRQRAGQLAAYSRLPVQSAAAKPVVLSA